MSTQLTETAGPVAASKAEALAAVEASRRLASYLPTKRRFQLRVEGEKRAEPMDIPPAAVKVLLNVLKEMAKGNAVSVATVASELTTSQAADLLNVSRPYLVKLLEAGKIPSRKVGVRRRVLYGDVMAYKKELFDSRLKALEELQAQAQELGMGY